MFIILYIYQHLISTAEFDNSSRYHSVKLPTSAVTFAFTPSTCQVKFKRLTCPCEHQDGIQWQGCGRFQFVYSFLTSVGEEWEWLASSSGSFTAIVTAPDIHCKGGWLFPSAEFSRHIFEKYANIKLYENPFKGSGVVLCGRTDRQMDRQTDMTKLIVAFRNFANALNIISCPIGNRTSIPLFASPYLVSIPTHQATRWYHKLINCQLLRMKCCALKNFYLQQTPCNWPFCVWNRIQKCK